MRPTGLLLQRQTLRAHAGLKRAAAVRVEAKAKGFGFGLKQAAPKDYLK